MAPEGRAQRFPFLFAHRIKRCVCVCPFLFLFLFLFFTPALFPYRSLWSCAVLAPAEWPAPTSIIKSYVNIIKVEPAEKSKRKSGENQIE